MLYSTLHQLRHVLAPVLLLTVSFTVVAQPEQFLTAIQGLQSRDADVRRKAVVALGWLKDTRATEPIIALLNDSDPSVSYAAAQALGLLGDVRAVEPLITALQGKNFSLKCAAAESLGRLKDPRAFEPLSVLLREGEGELQLKAQYALIEMGSMVVEPLCRILLDEDNPLRFYAAGLLVNMRDARAIKPLISVLGVGVNGIGPLAADALAGIGAPAVDELMVCLTSADPMVRRLAIKALGEIKDSRAFESLLAALSDENLEVRRQALLAVINFDGNDVMNAALMALQDPGLQVDASLFLAERKDLRALPYLSETLKSNDPLQADRARRALVTIGKPAVDELITILTDRNPEYPLREVRRNLELRKLPVAFRCGNEPPPPILDPRRLAAIALGQIGDERGIPALTDALNDESPELRADAARALEKLRAAAVEQVVYGAPETIGGRAVVGWSFLNAEGVGKFISYNLSPSAWLLIARRS